MAGPCALQSLVPCADPQNPQRIKATPLFRPIQPESQPRPRHWCFGSSPGDSGPRAPGLAEAPFLRTSAVACGKGAEVTGPRPDHPAVCWIHLVVASVVFCLVRWLFFRLALNLEQSCLSLPNAGIIGTDHQARLAVSGCVLASLRKWSWGTFPVSQPPATLPTCLPHTAQTQGIRVAGFT